MLKRRCICVSGRCRFCRQTCTPLKTCHGRSGLGDIVATGLAAVGITKERVTKVLGKPCACAKRQQQLNDLGRRLGIG